MSQRRLPAEVYWRRRLLVLAVVIALTWVAVQVIGGDDEPQATTPTRPAAKTTAPAAVEAPVNGTVDVTLVSASRSCDPERVRITPTVEPGQQVRGPVEIGLVVSSTEKSACTLTPAAADLVAVISANGTPVWDSTVCKASLLDEPVRISPQWATLVTATWSGRGSGGSCSAKEDYASPGTYAVQLGTLGGEPGKTSFKLKARPEPKQDEKSDDDKKPKPKDTTKPND